MTQHYLGVKTVEAWPQEKGGVPGYGVKYADGYISWSPKATFDRQYVEMGVKEGTTEPRPAPHRDTVFLNDNSVTSKMVDDFIFDIEATQEDERTTKVVVTLANGWKIREFSACVDPANFDMELGREIAVREARKKVWEYLGFLLACGLHGVDGAYPAAKMGRNLDGTPLPKEPCCGENEGCSAPDCTGYPATPDSPESGEQSDD